MEELHKAAEGRGKEKGNVIICPGGGYVWHSPREAQPVAEAFAAYGWTAWALRYAVAARGLIPAERPMRQLAQAVDMVRRERPDQLVVVCGFSAGGHVAASLAVHWQDLNSLAQSDRTIRPDAVVLAYPVVTSGVYAHRPSFEALLGPEPQGAAQDGWLRQLRYFSLEDHVSADTPPVFLWHTASDEMVPVQNSLLFAQRLAEEHVPFELHIYPRGTHGLSLATKEVEEIEKERWADEHVAEWFADCIRWLDIMLFTPKRT